MTAWPCELHAKSWTWIQSLACSSLCQAVLRWGRVRGTGPTRFMPEMSILDESAIGDGNHGR